jgi:AcrR family transcriptional regulator
MTPKTPKISPMEVIVDTAVRIFSERGYNATTMRDIAKEVGILPGSLYAHIESKEALLVEIVLSGTKSFQSIQKMIASSKASATDVMRAAIKEHIHIVAENPERCLIVFHQWRYLNASNRKLAVSMRRKYAQSFRSIIQKGIASGEFSPELDQRIAVFAILGALNWTPEWFSNKGPDKANEIGDKMVDFLLFALKHGMIGTQAPPKSSGKTKITSTSKG